MGVNYKKLLVVPYYNSKFNKWLIKAFSGEKLIFIKDTKDNSNVLKFDDKESAIAWLENNRALYIY